MAIAHRIRSVPGIHSAATCATAPPLHERRDPTTRERLRQRVRSEFNEMPGLALTLAQAVRLFGVREDVCVRVLGELGAEGLVHRTLSRRYQRRQHPR